MNMLLTPFELNVCRQYFTLEKSREIAACIAERMAQLEAQWAAEAAAGQGAEHG